MNQLHLSGEQKRIDDLLKSVKGEDSVLDFNKIIPMPESLNIECGSRTDRGLKAYKDFVYVYTFAGTEEKDLLNIPKEKEAAFLRARLMWTKISSSRTPFCTRKMSISPCLPC